MYIKIPQPDPKVINKTKVNDIMSSDKLLKLTHEFRKHNSPHYQSWGNKIKYKQNLPFNLKAEEFFDLLQIHRFFSAKETPVSTENKDYFTWQELDRFQKFFDTFSKEFGVRKNFQLKDAEQDILRKKNYEGIIEEAIASSQMEGANITRAQGRKLLKTGNRPTTNSEQMILNNYQTIQKIETEWKNEKMSLDLLLKIQATITHKTLPHPADEGRLRTDSDKIVVSNPVSGKIAFVPPSEKFIKKELKKFIKFANEEAPYDNFMWDIARAIILHFWLAYLHPFCDGNGRTARAIFYWYLLRKNFLYIGFLPISVRIRKSKTSYEEAFLLSEQDSHNLTYFFDYIVRQMQLSIKDFYQFEETQQTQIKQQAEIQKTFNQYKLNSRQIELIHHFLKHPHDFTTLIRHRSYHKITYVTSRKDIYNLVELGFLESNKLEKTIRFTPTPKLNSFL